MSYTESYQNLKTSFSLNTDVIDIPGTEMQIRNFVFESVMPDEISFSEEDNGIRENFQFRYPVIVQKNAGKSDKAIIFLHGLNERTWHKHLSGAEILAKQTGRPVILFPLSYHINRGLSEWTDIRKMSLPLELRKSQFKNLSESSVINVALSNRLTDDPGRFLLSGFQSINDLTVLIKIIKSGKHPLFSENTTTDFFAYSISCMLLQALIISNPGNLLAGSRIVLFAGGSVFEKMNGISRYIMDNVAFSAIRDYYLDMVTSSKKFILRDIRQLVMENAFGQAFCSMIRADRFRNRREKGLSAFYKDLMVISLQNDRVMPIDGIRQATGEKFLKTGRFKVLHFPYAYSHENPFPVLYDKLGKQIDDAFYSVFNPSIRFFCRE